MSNYSDGDFQTPYGTVTARNPGRIKPPPNLQRYQREAGDVVLQGPALRSFKEAEKAATPLRMRRKGKVLPILLTGVGYRSYELQRALFEGSDDPGRYADPDGSLHVEALAVDISMAQGVLRRQRIAYHLKKRGWHYAIDGEPWHASFKLSG
jgi:LAS superfamily LD-carboxypeptidase LdcB